MGIAVDKGARVQQRPGVVEGLDHIGVDLEDVLAGE